MSKRILILVVSFFVTLTGFAQSPCQQKEYFTLWNSCESITALTEYVQDVTNPYSLHYIPQEDRIATFDMDGTILGELYPTYFEYNMLEYRGLDDPTYQAPKDVKKAARASGTLSATGNRCRKGLNSFTPAPRQRHIPI